MTLLFSEHGSRVGCFDTDKEAVQTVLKQAKEDKVVDEKLVHGFSSLDKLVEAFPTGTSTPFQITDCRWEETSNACPFSTPR
jgi:6-phosphogluconate dehydrogenase